MATKGRNMTTIVVSFCIVVVTAFAGIAQADGGGWGCGYGGMHHRHSLKRLENKLALTDAQKTQVKGIFQANKSVVKPIITSLRAEQKKLRALIYADTVDAAAITSETTTISGIQAELNVNRATVAAQFRKILTPSQLEILKTLHQNHQNSTTTTQTPS